MFAHTEKALEYDKLKALLKKYAVSQLGASRVEKLTPQGDIDEIRRQQQLCTEATKVYQHFGGFPLNGLKDIAPLLRKSAKPGAILETEELLDVGRVAKVASKMQGTMRKLRGESLPHLRTMVGDLPTFPDLTQEVERCISPEGDVLDGASPALRGIRRQLIRTRENLHSKLESFLRSPQHQKSIQENVITFRNDRYVIPIKQDARSHFDGVVQGQSASGATVFVEPFGVVEHNNKLHQLAEEERQEIRRILISLTDCVREHLSGLEFALQLLGHLDFLGAKACLSIEVNGVEPVLNTRGFVKLTTARHPLLELNLRQQQRDGFSRNDIPEQIVPTDVHLGHPFHTLIITGPNTGGKTIVLKTVGLLTLMAQSGLHIPAQSGSEIAVFDQIFADIGDEQSIEQNLSTFSSHITKIVEFLKQIDDGFDTTGENSLVLLDEIGAGTDPTEGAALGMAILDWLGAHKVRTIVTTHYGALKAYAHSREGMENASMAFDWLTLSPTYRLQIGVPGSSNAIKIAERLGMLGSIVTAAKDNIGNQTATVEDLIVSMQESQRQLEVERAQVQEKIRATETVHQKHEALLVELETERDELKQKAEKEAFEVVNEARRLVDKTVADLRREQASKESIRTAFTDIDNAKVALKEKQSKRVETSNASKKRPDVKVGDKVRVKNLSRFGEVLSITKNKRKPLKVQVGNMQMQVSYWDIEPVTPQENNPKLSTSILDIQYSKVGTVKTELNLLGKTVGEALDLMDKYLDDAFLAGLPTVRVVHGKGTGALRNAIHGFLREHPSVKAFQSASRSEGGDGATTVTFMD